MWIILFIKEIVSYSLTIFTVFSRLTVGCNWMSAISLHTGFIGKTDWFGIHLHHFTAMMLEFFRMSLLTLGQIASQAFHLGNNPARSCFRVSAITPPSASTFRLPHFPELSWKQRSFPGGYGSLPCALPLSSHPSVIIMPFYQTGLLLWSYHYRISAWQDSVAIFSCSPCILKWSSSILICFPDNRLSNVKREAVYGNPENFICPHDRDCADMLPLLCNSACAA